MTARSGMNDLIDELRTLCAAGASDYTVGATTYWSDDQLQTILDRYRTDIKFYELAPIEEYASGAYVYKDYPIPYKYIEQSVDVLDMQGDAYGTALYSVDYDRGMVSFVADTGGAAVYINAAVYDLYRAAADVWRQKAAHVASRYDVKTDNQTLTRSQLMKQALEMAQLYDGMAGPQTVQVYRGDE